MSSNAMTIANMWDDMDVSVTGNDLKRKLPPIPEQKGDYQVVYGQEEVMALAILGIQATNDKEVIMRLLCSAVAACLKDKTTNYTGSKVKPIDCGDTTTLEDESKLTDTDLKCDFIDYPDGVTWRQWHALTQCDIDELAACIGIYVWATFKKPTEENLVAFNKNRRNAALAGTIDDPVIFVDDSPFLNYKTIRKINATFTSYGIARANMINSIIPHIPDCREGGKYAFATQFNLLREAGMGALAIIRDGLVHFPWIEDEFREVEKEIAIAKKAFVDIRNVPAIVRPFSKAIHGSEWIPLVYTEVAMLVGICKSALARTRLSYVNYQGGQITDDFERRLKARMDQPDPLAAII